MSVSNSCQITVSELNISQVCTCRRASVCRMSSSLDMHPFCLLLFNSTLSLTSIEAHRCTQLLVHMSLTAHQSQRARDANAHSQETATMRARILELESTVLSLSSGLGLAAGGPAAYAGGMQSASHPASGLSSFSASAMSSPMSGGGHRSAAAESTALHFARSQALAGRGNLHAGMSQSSSSSASMCGAAAQLPGSPSSSSSCAAAAAFSSAPSAAAAGASVADAKKKPKRPGFGSMANPNMKRYVSRGQMEGEMFLQAGYFWSCSVMVCFVDCKFSVVANSEGSPFSISSVCDCCNHLPSVLNCIQGQKHWCKNSGALRSERWCYLTANFAIRCPGRQCCRHTSHKELKT
jgi:hypothetical protein